MLDNTLRRHLWDHFEILGMAQSELVSIFEVNGALQTFSAKVNVAKAFDFISKETADSINLVRKLRNNHAAHTDEDFSFSEPYAKELLDHLAAKAQDVDALRAVARGAGMGDDRILFALGIARLSMQITADSNDFKRLRTEGLKATRGLKPVGLPLVMTISGEAAREVLKANGREADYVPGMKIEMTFDGNLV